MLPEEPGMMPPPSEPPAGAPTPAPEAAASALPEAAPAGGTARRLRRLALEAGQTLLQAALLYFLVTTFVGRFEIHQISMEPNFHEGQRVVVSQFGSVLTPWLAGTAYAADGRAAALLGPKRGQVVVFHPDTEHRLDPLIKRVIGLPGERVEVRDGGVFVNDQRLDEPYLNGLETRCYTPCGVVRLEPDEYFMLGDNRPNSRDSRSFGPIHLDQIIGRVVLRYWPLNRLQAYP